MISKLVHPLKPVTTFRSLFFDVGSHLTHNLLDKCILSYYYFVDCPIYLSKLFSLIMHPHPQN